MMDLGCLILANCSKSNRISRCSKWFDNNFTIAPAPLNKRPTWREAGGFETILEIRIRRPCLVYDIRRLNLDSINSMDLFRLADQLRAAYQSERHVPGKTAIVYREDGPPIYSSSQRLFHNFSIWAKEHQLPRDFSLFSAMADAVA